MGWELYGEKDSARGNLGESLALQRAQQMPKPSWDRARRAGQRESRPAQLERSEQGRETWGEIRKKWEQGPGHGSGAGHCGRGWFILGALRSHFSEAIEGFWRV